VLKNFAGLLKTDAGKPFNELVDRSTIFKVFKECCYRHARATKKPSSAIALGVVFDSMAGGPVNHLARIAPGGILRFSLPQQGLNCDA